MLRFSLSPMAAWNITKFRDVATKGPQSLPSSWCSMYTLKYPSLQEAEIVILLKNDLSAGRKEEKYWLKESYPSSVHSSGTVLSLIFQILCLWIHVAKVLLRSHLCIWGPKFRLQHLNHPKTQIFGCFHGLDSICLVWDERCNFQWF